MRGTQCLLARKSYSSEGARRLPRLWNAHKKIESGRIYVIPARKKRQYTKKDILPETVSQDVRDFVVNAKLQGEARLRCLQNPNQYFSRPHNVPPELRRQIYLPKPDDVVSLYRTPHLPPKYASFWVPLWFNKLDMKSYLNEVYGVAVVHIRSFVQQQKVTRKPIPHRGLERYDQGRLTRERAKKKMTVELVEPFVWPEEEQDLSPWEKDLFYSTAREQLAANKKMGEQGVMEPDLTQRKSIAEQAKALLAGRASWKPTWQSIPADSRVMQGSNAPSI